MNLIGPLIFVVSVFISTQTNAQEAEATTPTTTTPAVEWCPPGSYGDSASCTLCTPGTYATYAGQQECYNCHVGSYADVAGATVCTPCPVNYHSSTLDGGTTFESTCKANTIAKIKIKFGLPISLAAFDTLIQNGFKRGIAVALQIDVSHVAITEVRDTTTSLTRRRLLQENDESSSIEVTTATLVPTATVNSTIALITEQSLKNEIQLSTGIVASWVSTPEVTHISTRHTTLMKSEKRLISLLSACPCVRSQ